MPVMAVALVAALCAAGCGTRQSMSQETFLPGQANPAEFQGAANVVPESQTPAKPPVPSSKPAAAQAHAVKPAGTNAVPAAPILSGKIKHAAVGCLVTASSTSGKEHGEGGPEALVDGDLATRWSSAYSAPQQITLHFAAPLRVARLRLYWEQASARRYSVSVTQDGTTWTGVHVYMNLTTNPVPRIDDINLRNIAATGLRLDLLERVNPAWGFSLHEIEVMAAP